MGLFNNYYGRSYADRKPSSSNTNNNNSRNGNSKTGGQQQQQRRGEDSWSGGSATNSPEPIDFSVNDIVFERRKVTSGDSMMTGRSQPTVNWRQNDIDFGRQQRGGQKQCNSVSSDDCSDGYPYPPPKHQQPSQYGGYNNSSRYGSSYAPQESAARQLGSSYNSGYTVGSRPVYNSSSSYTGQPSYNQQTILDGCNSNSSYGQQRGSGYNSYEMPPTAAGYSGYEEQQPAYGYNNYNSPEITQQPVCKELKKCCSHGFSRVYHKAFSI